MAKDKLKAYSIEPELVYILGTSRDTLGRRVVVKYDNVENTIYPETLKEKAILPLLGVEAKELALISEFLTER